VKPSFFLSIVGGAIGAMLLGGTYALATNFSFVLGSTSNAPDALTAVTAKNVDGHGGLNGSMIRLTNNSTSTNATALALGTNPNRAPFTTNSPTKVVNLNADRLDGIDSTGFAQGRLVTAAVQLDPNDQSQFVLDQSSQKPSYSLTYFCPSDLSSPGTIFFRNASATVVADLVSSAETSDLTAGQNGALGAAMAASGGSAAFSGHWYDGHILTAWVFSQQRDDQPDPRNDGCYVQAMVLVK
jgi:hypothetical protein